MRSNLPFFLLPTLLLLLTACVPLIGTIDVDFETETPVGIVPTSTLEASPSETTQITAFTNGTVKGRVCYPSEVIPTMKAQFKDIITNQVHILNIAENQGSYTINLPGGKYIAYITETPLTGIYSHAVLCGLSVDCTDHTPVKFEVVAGEVVEGIDLCDWYPPIIPSEDTYLTGLTYRTSEETYYRYAYQNTKPIFGVSGMDISPDSTRGVYANNGDLFVINLSTGAQYNLTNTPRAYEVLYEWLLPETIFLSILPEGDVGGPGLTGGLYMIQADGSGLTAFDASTNVGKMAVSPDGTAIAYGAGPTASVYDIQTSQIRLFPSEFGIYCEGSCSPSSPEWSPDGQKLAWWVQGDFYGEDAFAVGIFDLNLNTWRIFHPYQLAGMGGFHPSPKFSSDGNWIAFQTFDIDEAKAGVWVVSISDPNQSIEIFLGVNSRGAVWSPYGQYLAYNQYDETEGVDYIYIYNVMTDSKYRLEELPPAEVLEWK